MDSSSSNNIKRKLLPSVHRCYHPVERKGRNIDGSQSNRVTKTDSTSRTLLSRRSESLTTIKFLSGCSAMKRCYKETGKCDGSDITEVLKTDLTSRSALFSGSTTSEYGSTLLTLTEALLGGTDVPNATLSTSYLSTLFAEKDVPVVTLSNFHSSTLFDEKPEAQSMSSTLSNVKGSCESVRAPPTKEFHSKNVNPNVPKKPLLHYGSLSRSTLNERKKSEFTIKRLRF